jgi:hypothetical protein
MSAGGVHDLQVEEFTDFSMEDLLQTSLAHSQGHSSLTSLGGGFSSLPSQL